jgi:hypothetical protein
MTRAVMGATTPHYSRCMPPSLVSHTPDNRARPPAAGGRQVFEVELDGDRMRLHKAIVQSYTHRATRGRGDRCPAP